MLPIYWSGCMKILHRWVTIPCIHEKVGKGVTPLAQTFLKGRLCPGNEISLFYHLRGLGT